MEMSFLLIDGDESPSDLAFAWSLCWGHNLKSLVKLLF